ncbi:MAG: asparagine synthase-related protein [Pseudomonadota bacterium]
MTIPSICGLLALDHASNDALEGMARYRAACTSPSLGSDRPPQCLEYNQTTLLGPSATSGMVDDIMVSVDGRIRWLDPDLGMLAKDVDNAAALSTGYRRYGVKLLDRIGGEFGLAILDPRGRRGLIAVDRLGIRPLAYWSTEYELGFASRADTAANLRHEHPELEPQALYHYLYFHVVPSPDCVFAGITKLPPAHFVHFEDGAVNVETYWQPNYVVAAGAPSERAQELRDLARAAVSRAGNDRVGTFLSGGLDSSTVTGLAVEVDSSRPAFAMGFNAEGYDEMSFARASAKHFGVTLHEHYVTEQEVVDAVPILADGYDEPFGNASAVPTYYCAQLAASAGVDRLLAGDGGDEIFAGNERYATQLLFEHFARLPKFAQTTLKRLAPSLSKLSFAPLRKVGRYTEQAVVPLPERMESYNLLGQHPIEATLGETFLNAVNTDGPIDQLRAVFNRASTDSVLSRMLFLDLKFTLADNDLRKVGLSSGLAGMAVSYPLLDHEMVEFAASLPPDWLLKRGDLRAFYRNTFSEFLAPETLSKSKHGFGLPFGLWLREYAPLQTLATDSLHALSERGIIRADYVEHLLRSHESQHAAYFGVMVWILMMLERWLDAHGNPGIRM